MMKKHVILFGILGLILNISMQAQILTKFSTGFETGTATDYTITGSNTYSTTYYSGGSRALLLQQSRTAEAILLLDTIDLSQTNPSLQYATLEFMHICKVRAQSTMSPVTQTPPFGAIIEVKRVDEENWTQLGGALYDRNWGGGSSDFSLNDFFSDYSYSTSWNAGVNSDPDNSMWKKERFNLGSLFSSARPENRKIQIRFRLPKAAAPQTGANADSRPIYFGWLLDNIVVNASASSLAVPVIKMLEYPIQVSADPAGHPTSRDVLIKANISTTVAQGMCSDSVYVVYKLGALPYEKVNMTRQGTTDVWTARIPFCGYDTLVAFRIVARDATLNFNKATFPNDESAYSYYYCVRGNDANTGLQDPTTTIATHPFPTAGDCRSEYVYDAQTLHAAGYYSGAISQLQFQVASGGGTTLNNFTIKMQNVNTTHQTSSADFSTTDMKTVYEGSYRTPSGSGTVGTIVFMDTFYYSGNDILMQICYNNASDGAATTIRAIPTVTNKEALSIPLNASWGMDACTYTNGGTDTKRPYFIFKSNKNLPLMKDMGIESILLPSQSTQANTPSSIQVSLRNMGMTTINGVTIYYSIDGGPAQSYQWFGSLAGQTSTPVTITTTAQFTPGFKRIKAWVGDTLEIGSVSYIDHEPLNDTIENTFIACDGPMSGVRNVGGATPDYANIDEVIEALYRCGVNGPLTIRLEPKVYERELSLPIIQGVSATNVITFEPMNGPGTVVFKTPNRGSCALDLQYSSYIKFKNILFTTPSVNSSNVPYIVKLGVTSRGCEFDSCSFIDSTVVGLSSLVFTGGASDFKVQNCYFKGGIVALNLMGSAADNCAYNNSVYRSYFEMSRESCIRATNQISLIIDSNELNNTSTNPSFVLMVQTCHGNSWIINNKVYSSNGASCFGATDFKGSASAYAIVANNMFVTESSTTNTIYTPVNIMNAEKIKYVYNTSKINVSNYSNISAATIGGSLATDVHVLNNIFVSTTANNYAFNFIPTSNNFVIDHNLYYSAGATLNRYNGTQVANYTAWKNLLHTETGVHHDTNSLFLLPVFLNVTPTDLRTVTTAIQNAGTPVSEITTDMFGTLRDTLTPCIGAYESAPLLHNIALEEVLSPLTSCTLTVTEHVEVVLKNHGYATIPANSATFYYRRDNGNVVSQVIDREIQPLDTIHFRANTTTNLSAATIRQDRDYNFTVWAALSSDDDKSNDTIHHVVSSLYQLQAPTAQVVPVNYGTAIQLIAQGATSPVYWYENDSTDVPFLRAQSYQTDTLYRDVTYYVAQRDEVPLLKITEVQYNKQFNGLTYPYPSYMSSNVNFAVELSNVGNYPINIGGDTLLIVSKQSSYNNKVVTLPDVTIQPGTSYVIIYRTGAYTDSLVHYAGVAISAITNQDASRSYCVGIIYKSNGVVRDAVLLNSLSSTASDNTWWTSQGVPSSVWTGNFSLTGTQSVGIRRINASSNSSSGWVVCNGSPHSMSLGTLESNLILHHDNGCLGYRSAIQVTVQNIPAMNLQVSNVNVSNEGCSLYDETISLDLTNLGIGEITNPVVQYSVDGVLYPADTLNQTVGPFSSISHTFTSLADLRSYNLNRTYNVKVWVHAVNGDNVRDNDTVRFQVQSFYTPNVPIVDSVWINEYATTDTLYSSVPLTDTLAWYDQNGNLLHIGNTFITDTLYQDTRYQVKALGVVYEDAHLGSLATATLNNVYGPYNSSYKYRKEQYIIKARELAALGYESGIIQHLSFYLDSVMIPSGEAVYSEYTINMATTSDSVFSGNNNWKSVPLQVYHVTNDTINNSQKGWRTHVLDTAFTWDGQSNIVIQVCYALTERSGKISTRYTTASTNSVLYKGLDNVPMCDTLLTGSRNAYRPDIKFGFVGYACESEARDIVVTLIGDPEADISLQSIVGLEETGNLSGTPTEIAVSLKNYGSDVFGGVSSPVVDSLIISWELDGTLMSSTLYTEALLPAVLDTAVIDTHSFTPGTHCIRIYITCVKDTIKSNDTVSGCFLFCFPAGTQYIGQGQTYATFNDAITSLTGAGICGPVVFEVSPGIYNEQIIIPSFSGLDSVNTITFRSSTGNPADVVIKYIPTSTNNFVVKFSETHDISFENMTVYSTTATNSVNNTTPGNVLVLENSRELSFVGNIFRAKGSTLVKSSQANAITLTKSVSDVIFMNNIIDSSYVGILNKVGDVDDNISNVIIQNNEIRNFYFRGISLRKVGNVDIVKNRVEAGSFDGGKQLTGIYLTEHYGIFDVSQNIVNLIDNKNGLKQGIHIGVTTGTSIEPNRLYNNMVSVVGNGNATIKTLGIYVDSSSYLNVYFNTVRVQAGANSSISRGIEFVNTDNVVVKNNIFSNFGKGYAYYVTSPTCVALSDFNNFYSNSSADARKFVYWGQDVDSIGNLIVLSNNDLSSLDEKPYFRSTDDLHLSLGTTVGKAEYLTDVTIDIDDVIRSSIPRPTIGAHEYIRPIHDLAVMEILSPVVLTEYTRGLVDSTTTLVEGDSMLVLVKIINTGSSLETGATWDAYIAGNEGLRSIQRVLPAMNPQDVLVDSVYIPMVLGVLDTQIVVSQVSCVGDTSAFNDTVSNLAYLYPAFNLQAMTTAVDVGDGCRLYNAPVIVTLKNVGKKSIPTNLPIGLGYQATFKSQSGSTVSPSTLPTVPYEETVYLSEELAVNTTVDVTISNYADIYPHGLTKDIKVDVRSWAKLMYDVKENNDTTAKVTVNSYHTPVTPVGIDTTIPFATLVKLDASQSQNRPIRWHLDSLAEPFFEAANYNLSRSYTLESTIFSDTVFYLSAISPAGCTSYYDILRVTVLNPKEYDVSPIAVEEPVNKVYMSQDTIKIRLKNYGTQPISNIPVTYKKYRSNNVNSEYQEVTEICGMMIQPNDEYVFAFDSLANFEIITGVQSYTIEAWTNLANEQTRENDTIVTVRTPINEVTYCEPQISGSSGLDITRVRTGLMDNSVTPIGHTYMNFVNYTLPNIPTLSLYKNLTDTLFVSAQDNESYESRSPGFVRAYIDWNRDGMFNENTEVVMVSDTLFSGSTVSSVFTVPADAYYGHTRMRVILNAKMEQDYNAARDTFAFPREGVCPVLASGCVQDYLVNIRKPLQNNVALVRVVNPVDGMLGRTDSIRTVQLLLANYGTSTVTDVVINYSYNGDTATYNWTGNLLSMESQTISLPEHIFGRGTTVFSAWINPANDQDTTDNFVWKEFHRFHQIQLEYRDGFEDMATKMYAPAGRTKYDRNLWEVGSPAKNRITTVKTGVNAMVTDADATVTVSGTYGNRSILYSPIFDIGQVKPDTLIFWMARNIPDNASLKIEYLNYQSKWKAIGSATDGKSDSWYNGGTEFTSNSAGYSYEKCWYPLSSISGTGDFAQYTQLRFVYTAKESAAAGDGVSIDDIEIKRAQRAIDVGIVDIPYPTTPKFGQTISPKVVIKNYGYDTIRECVVAYHPHGSALPKRETWRGVLAPNDTVSYVFSSGNTFTIDKTFPDTFAICAYTINEQDLYWDNDSVCLDFYLSPLDVDAGMIEIVKPSGNVIAGDSVSVTLKVRNFGATPIETMRVAYMFNGEEPVYETVNFIDEMGEALQTFEYYDYTFNQKIRAVMGVMEISGTTILVNDEYVYNDSLTSRIYGISAVADISPVEIVLSESYTTVNVGLKIANVGSLGVNNFEVGFYYDNDTNTLVREVFFREGNPVPALDTVVHVFDTVLAKRTVPYDVFKAFVYYRYDVDNTNDTTTAIVKGIVDMRADTVYVEENENPDCRVRIKVTNVGTGVVGGESSTVLRAVVNGVNLSTNTRDIMLPDHSYEIMFPTKVPKHQDRYYEGTGKITAANDVDATNNETNVVMAVDYFGIVNIVEDSIVLEQNYPNPFADKTTIDFSIPTSGNVKFFVVNTLGRMVYQTSNFYEQGRHSIDFSYAGLTTGIYYYGIEVNGKRLMRKMIFRK